MNVVNGVVELTGTREVDTRNGKKDTYSFKVNGTWYKTGFKNPGVSKGQIVSFDYTPGKWGNDVDVASIVIGGSATPPPPNSVQAPAKPFRNGGFPIDPLDGQRSILRQNAVTNAREIVALSSVECESMSVEHLLSLILTTAKHIEAYTSGDDDMEAAKASVGE